LLTGVAAGSFAATENDDSQTVTGTHLANPQTARPATGGTYGMSSTTRPAYPSAAPQTNAPASPDAVHPELPLSNSNGSAGGGGGGAR
jgi:hypothetical protein